MCWCVFRNRRRFAAVKKGYTAEWRHTEWRTQTQLAKPHTKRDISLVGWLIIRPENDSLRLCACFCPKAVWPHGLILLHGQFYCLVILTRNDRIISFNNKWIVCLYILLWICRFSACAVPQQRSVFFFFFFIGIFWRMACTTYTYTVQPATTSAESRHNFSQILQKLYKPNYIPSRQFDTNWKTEIYLLRDLLCLWCFVAKRYQMREI